jgi:uncharacterized membrane protein
MNMKKINWTTLAVFAVVALLAFMVGTSLFGRWGYGGYGMMGGYGGHMGWGYSPFGWFGMGLGMLFMALIPLGFLVLTVLGILWLVRAVSGNTPAPTASHPCPNCGKAVQADWQNCPYCGTALK